MRDLYTLKQMIYQIRCILNKKQRRKMIGMFFVILFGALLELLGVSAMLPFIQSILSPYELLSRPYVHFFLRFLNTTDPASLSIVIGLMVVFVYVFKNLYLLVSYYLQSVYCNTLYKDLSILMLNSYMTRPYSFYVENGSDVIMRGVNTYALGVFRTIHFLFIFLSEAFIVMLLSVYLFMTDPFLALGILATGIVCLTGVVLGLKRRISIVATVFKEAEGKRFKWIMQISSGIKDIILYGRQKLFLRKYESAAQACCEASAVYDYSEVMPERIIEAVCVSGIAIVIVVRLKMGVDVEAFVPKMAVFAMGAFRLLPSVSRMAGCVNSFVYRRPQVEAAYENVTAARRYKNSIGCDICETGSEDLINTFDGVFEKVIIRDVCWKYPESRTNILDEFSLVVEKGDAIGVIGQSGVGKSTLADILLRLYIPQKGEILLDDTNIESIPETWSNMVGYVPQSIFLMDDTIKENITFGLEVDDEGKLWNALRKSSLEKFVKELPNGVDTIIGENGVKLSGGQRQRIAIARALYAEPQILVMDEATSALDSETEEAVIDAIDLLVGQITLIIIAHRVTTLRSCDKIYEIVGGKAIERRKEEIIV